MSINYINFSIKYKFKSLKEKTFIKKLNINYLQ